MMWYGISWRHKPPLVVVVGNMTSLRYVHKVLQPVVLPFLQNHENVIMFQHDNTRPHSARHAMDFHAINVRVRPWPEWPTFSLD
jgi:hypothetical protein